MWNYHNILPEKEMKSKKKNNIMLCVLGREIGRRYKKKKETHLRILCSNVIDDARSHRDDFYLLPMPSFVWAFCVLNHINSVAAASVCRVWRWSLVATMRQLRTGCHRHHVNWLPPSSRSPPIIGTNA
nr:hypothetical protein CFP56_46146 [Quercus suber]